jgi:hypothetical protein
MEILKKIIITASALLLINYKLEANDIIAAFNVSGRR